MCQVVLGVPENYPSGGQSQHMALRSVGGRGAHLESKLRERSSSRHPVHLALGVRLWWGTQRWCIDDAIKRYHESKPPRVHNGTPFPEFEAGVVLCAGMRGKPSVFGADSPAGRLGVEPGAENK